MTYDNAGVG